MQGFGTKVKLFGVGKDSHLAYVNNWTNQNNSIVSAESYPYQAWNDWSASQRTLFILDKNGTVQYQQNISNGISNSVYDLVEDLISDIDYLVLGENIIEAKDIKKSISKKMTVDREKKINDNHKQALALLTKNYNLNERKKYFKIEEKKAYWNAIEKPLHDLNKNIDIWLREKRKIILYGTFDHTKLLIDNVSKFIDLNIVGFIPYKNINDEINNSKKVNLPIKNLKNIKDVYDKKTTILISSYEFSYDIEKKLNNEFPSAEYYKLYTGYTRNLSYYFNTKKN